ncbi:MAG: aminotransferase class V-fold PLP-dependent enzyme [Planctomycetes bacterium]|nr:aminotransferase class V-fold PLP-dependent enzyme [Planctomycetota bacterium]
MGGRAPGSRDRLPAVQGPPGRAPALQAIDERTLIVPISHVCFRNSYKHDALAVCRRAREVGALVLLDTYQSLGTVPVDVQALGVDMVCGGSVKWLCGGPGAGYLYVRPDLLERLEPRITGWAAHAAPFAFELGAQRYAPGPARLLHGSPAVPALLAATAGYELIAAVGVERIRAWSIVRTEALREDLLARGFEVPSPADPENRGGTLTVRLAPGEDGTAFVAALEERGILVDHRPEAGLRVSPHFYTRGRAEEFRRRAHGAAHAGGWKQHLGARKAAAWIQECAEPIGPADSLGPSARDPRLPRESKDGTLGCPFFRRGRPRLGHPLRKIDHGPTPRSRSSNLRREARALRYRIRSLGHLLGRRRAEREPDRAGIDGVPAGAVRIHSPIQRLSQGPGGLAQGGARRRPASARGALARAPHDPDGQRGAPGESLSVGQGSPAAQPGRGGADRGLGPGGPGGGAREEARPRRHQAVDPARARG